MQRLHLLGPVRVVKINNTQNGAAENIASERTAREVPRFRSRRTIALLGYLVAEKRPITRDFLARLFWPDEETSKGRANLRRELHNLTQILPDCWDLDQQIVAFSLSANTEVDIYKLQKLEAQESWLEAKELLGTEFLEALYLENNLEFDNWLTIERDRWRRRTETVLTHVIDGHIRRGHYSDALQQCQRLLQIIPWSEKNHQKTMRLLAWTGQRGAALRQFETCKQVLKDELNIEPAEATVALYQQIQAGELDLLPQIPAFLTEEAARRDVDRPLFVAREREMQQLDIALNAALAGQGRVVFVTGGPGRGKTALMETFAQHTMKKHSNLLVASGNCDAYSGIGDPYLPFRDVMAMLTGDVESKWDAGAITREHASRLWAAFPLVVQALLDYVPHLMNVLVPSTALLSRAISIEQTCAPWLPQLREHIKHQQLSSQDINLSYLFQQFTRMLQTVADQQPLMLILDDMQWADTASISLLFHLGRRLVDIDSRVLIVCAYRPEEINLGRDGKRHPLAKILNEFKLTYGNIWVDLTPSKDAEARRFVDAILDIEPNRLTETFRTSMLQRTGAHPLFTVELLRAMQERGDLRKDEDDFWIEGASLNWKLLPKRVEAVIEERIDRLESEMQEILTIASVEGEMFTAQVVAEVHKIEERQLLHQLSSNLEQQHRLVREQEGVETNRRYLSRFRFRHVLFQDYLYRRLGPGERQLLHADVAAALEKLYDKQMDEISIQLAHHFYQAGDFNRACVHYTQAAQRATQFYANEEAITHFNLAIELEEFILPETVSLAKLYHGRGMAYQTLGIFNLACADFEKALQVAHTTGDHQNEWRALIALGRLWASRNYNQTRNYFKAALELARRIGEPGFLASSLNWMGNWHANAENPDRAIIFHQEALKISKNFENLMNLTNTLDLLGIAYLLGGNPTSAVESQNQAITLFRNFDDRPRLISSLIGRSSSVSLLVLLASLPPTHPPDPEHDLKEAICIAQEIGSLTDIAWAHWELSILSVVQGDFGHALKYARNGLQLALDIGHREWEVGNRFALGIIFYELFAPDDAMRELKKALSLAGELQSQYWIHHVTGVLAATYSLLEDLTQTQICLDTVISPQTPMDTQGKRYCWVRRAELALAQENPELALDIIHRLIASAPGLSSEDMITFLWKLKGDALAALGFADEAFVFLNTALGNVQITGEQFLLWRIHASLGHLYRKMGRHPDAENEISVVYKILEDQIKTISDTTMKNNVLQSVHDVIRDYHFL